MMKEVQRASVEQVADQLEKHARQVFPTAIVPSKAEGVAGETITVSGDFIVPPVSPGAYTLRLRLHSVALGSIALGFTDFTVIEEQQEPLSAAEVKAAYEQAFSECNEQGWHLLDSEYQRANLEEIQAVLDSTEIDDMIYEASSFDCDDFTFALMGAFHMDYETAAQAIFYTMVTWESDGKIYGHAVCSCYTGEQVLIIEPQTDAVYTVPETWRLARLIG